MGARGILLLLLLLGPVCPFSAVRSQQSQEAEEPGRESEFLSRVRQLTFEGRRAGEGYFSADGTRLVFQSEREPDNPFYQIYELSFETGETRRISPGVGKTTCAYYRPGTDEILFASTHHDPQSRELQRAELELRATGRERRYSWDYDPEMELYVAAGRSGELARLTRIQGYDAEGSYSPDGRWIVFASTRDAYVRELDDRERKQLEIDPAYFAEIYIMHADGTEPRRLTTAVGYDGGPFFSPDGKKIIWRRFDEQGLIADLWTMDPDGNAKRRITDFGSMSWAPYPHPSGEYVFFTSNKHGFQNFELFIVDLAGLKRPVRVTYTDRFDGLPVPSPDGELLAWTSQRNGKDAQIYLGRWNHAAALEALQRSPARAAGREEEAPP